MRRTTCLGPGSPTYSNFVCSTADIGRGEEGREDLIGGFRGNGHLGRGMRWKERELMGIGVLSNVGFQIKWSRPARGYMVPFQQYN